MQERMSDECQTSASLQRKGRWRGGLCLGQQWGPAFAPCGVVQDRLELVPATDPAWLHSEPPRNAVWCSPHPATLAGAQDETGNPNPVSWTMPVMQSSNCPPWWVNKRKTWLKYIPFLLSCLPARRTRALFHSTKELYISTSHTEEATTYRIRMGHPYHENMEKFFYLHI